MTPREKELHLWAQAYRQELLAVFVLSLAEGDLEKGRKVLKKTELRIKKEIEEKINENK